MYRIENVSTNPIALPKMTEDSEKFEEWVPNEEGHFSKVIKERSVEKAETFFIDGTHHERMHQPEFEDISNEDYKRLAKSAFFDRLVESGRLRVTKL